MVGGGLLEHAQAHEVDCRRRRRLAGKLGQRRPDEQLVQRLDEFCDLGGILVSFTPYRIPSTYV